eukprot:158090_1
MCDYPFAGKVWDMKRAAVESVIATMPILGAFICVPMSTLSFIENDGKINASYWSHWVLVIVSIASCICYTVKFVSEFTGHLVSYRCVCGIAIFSLISANYQPLFWILWYDRDDESMSDSQSLHLLYCIMAASYYQLLSFFLIFYQFVKQFNILHAAHKMQRDLIPNQ